jgi:hypothetical protein
MCHIDKVMAVAFTAFAFDESIEDGGKGVKLGLYRVQEARAAKKLVKRIGAMRMDDTMENHSRRG